MINTLSKLDLRLQEKILKRLYWNMSIEEVRIEEDKQPRCIWEYNNWNPICVWLPPTLARVLSALGDDYFYKSTYIVQASNFWDDWDTIWYSYITHRKLLNEDKTEMSLFDQDEYVKQAIDNLL